MRTRRTAVFDRPQFPLELLGLIATELNDDYGTLASLAMMNKLLCEDARKLLYRTAGNLGAQRKEDNRWRRLPSPKLITQYPHLAKYIHTYIVRQDDYTRGESDIASDIKPLLPGSALSQMVNVKELHLRLKEDIPVNLLKGAPFQLTTFILNKTHPTKSIFAFLKTQHVLLRFESKSARAAIKSFPPTLACPDLKYLRGPHSVIRTILPGRKLDVLIWDVSRNEIADQRVDDLAEELGTLRALSYVRSSMPVLVLWGMQTNNGILFANLAMHAKNLEYLEISMMEPNEIFDHLKLMPRLVGIIFGTDTLHQRSMKVIEKRTVCRELFIPLPNLQFIDIQIKPAITARCYSFERAGFQIFERWVMDRAKDKIICAEKKLICADLLDHIDQPWATRLRRGEYFNEGFTPVLPPGGMYAEYE